MSQVPLEPQLLVSCEKGKCFMSECPDSVTASKFEEIVKQIIKE